MKMLHGKMCTYNMQQIFYIIVNANVISCICIQFSKNNAPPWRCAKSKADMGIYLKYMVFFCKSIIQIEMHFEDFLFPQFSISIEDLMKNEASSFILI